VRGKIENVVTAAKLDTWRWLFELGGLTGPGILAVRGALADPEAAGLLPTAAGELLLCDLDALIARRYRVDPGDIPGGSPLAIEDFPPDG
jgi:hypothetical protein